MTIPLNIANARETSQRNRQLYPASRAERVIGHGLLILLSFVAIFPIFWMFSTSLKPANEINELNLFPLAPCLASGVAHLLAPTIAVRDKAIRAPVSEEYVNHALSYR